MSEYDSIEDAAAAALARMQKLPDFDKKEYLGVIYQDEKSGKYRFTEPTGGKDSKKVKGTFAVPKGSLRAIVHNHPGAAKDANARFSEDDVRMAKQLGVPSFIGVGNQLLRWHPEKGQMRRSQGVGEEVLSQIPTDQLSDKRRLLAAIQIAQARGK